jgi:hypothetical protein
LSISTGLVKIILQIISVDLLEIEVMVILRNNPQRRAGLAQTHNGRWWRTHLIPYHEVEESLRADGRRAGQRDGG